MACDHYDHAVIFVYRSHYAGPLSKRVVHRPDASVLAWFQRGWYEKDHDQWLATEVGDDVYGLHSIFDAAREHDLAMPRDWPDLHRLLGQHLYVEGEIRADEQALRVLTDDDEVQLAYFLLDDATLTQVPERLAYLVHPQWPLPSTASREDGFTSPVPVHVAASDPAGRGATYAVFLTHDDGKSIACTPTQVIPGVRLPDLASALRAADPTASPSGDWPAELVALRSLLDGAGGSIAPALERYNRSPGIGVGEPSKTREPERSLIAVDEHIAQFAVHVDDYFGYQQWFLFDDLWAASHAHLASSLLRYAADWDPFA